MERKRVGLLVGALITALALAAAASAALVSGKPTSAAAPTPVKGGTLVIGAEQDVPGLNLWLACCTTSWGQYMVGPVIRGAYRQYPDYSLHEDLVTTTDVGSNPFSLTYHIK